MKFDMPYGQKPMLYVPHFGHWEAQERVFVVFGIFDALSLAVAGFAGSSPTAGKGSLDVRWFDQLNKLIYIMPDRGEDKEAYEYAAKLDWRGRVCKLEYNTDEKDVNDILVRRGPEGLRDAMESGVGSGIRIRDERTAGFTWD